MRTCKTSSDSGWQFLGFIKKTSTEKINNKQYMRENTLKDSYYAYFYPIYEADRNILAYTNRLVPLYVLQQLYYRLNKIYVDAKILKK